jgi:NADPH-dependent ferric siderophore reductase
MTDAAADRIARLRREPPKFRTLHVLDRDAVSPHMARVTLAGRELDGLTVDEPAASVRVLLPSPKSGELVMPTWNGNEFLLPDGRRPTLRTFTPLRIDSERQELELWVVLHDGGAASAWVATVAAGDSVAVSGPGRGYTIDRDAPAFLIAGDETAIPAMVQLLETLPSGPPVQVLIEVAHRDARVALPDHPSATVTWLDLPPDSEPGAALFDAVRAADIDPAARIWAAGEAAAVQRIRKHLFDERGFARAQTTVRGYWKHGRRGDDG